MSTINTVRIINLNYNNNSIRVNDETFNLNGESTLISLHNGGGKSVLVQMLTAAFVHSKYRNAKDRPFESYFTSARPTIVLIEWLLDRSGNKVTTGYMVRQNQERDEENLNPLDFMTIISEYNDKCIYDINSLPVVEKTKKEIVLKSYSECKNIFENLKKDHNKSFFCYDMNYQAQSKQYFDKLREYKIDYREWEHIIKKINEKESGLSELFADCKNESGLVDKWLLDTVEKKLDPEKEKIKSFREIIGKYGRQYRDNETKIKERDHIRIFKDNIIVDDESRSVKTIAEDYSLKITELEKQKNKIADFRRKVSEQKKNSRIESERLKDEIIKKESEIQDVIYDKYSYELYDAEKEIQYKLHEREQISLETASIKKKLSELKRQIVVLDCARKYDLFHEESAAFQEKNAKLRLLHEKNDDKLPRMKNIGAALYNYYFEALRNSDEQKKMNLEKIKENEKASSEAEKALTEISAELQDCFRQLGQLNFEIENFTKIEESFNQEYRKEYSRNLLGFYEEGIFEIESDLIGRKLKSNKENINKISVRIDEITRNNELLLKEKIDLEREKSALEQKLSEQEEKVRKLDREIEDRKVMIQILQLELEDVFDKETIQTNLNKKISESEILIRELSAKRSLLEKEIKNLDSGKVVELPEEVIAGIEKLGIRVVYGMEWLLRNTHSLEENLDLVRNNPFLPYSVIMTAEELKKFKESGDKIYSSLPLPILQRADIEKGHFDISNKMISFDKVKFYINFDERLVDKDELKKLIEDKKIELKKTEEKIDIRREEREKYYSEKGILDNQLLTRSVYSAAISAKDDSRAMLEEFASKISENALNKEEADKEMAEKKLSLKQMKEETDRNEKYSRSLLKFEKEYQNYKTALETRSKTDKTIEKLKNRELLADNEKKKCYALEAELRNNAHDIEIRREELSKELSLFNLYKGQKTELEVLSDEELLKMSSEYNAIKEQFSGEISELEADIKRIGKRLNSIKRDLDKTADSESIKDSEYKNISYDEYLENGLKKEAIDTEERLGKSISSYNSCENRLSAMEQNRKNILQNMKKDTGMEAPKEKGKIGNLDFDSRKNILEHQKKIMSENLSMVSDNIMAYSSIIENTDEYSDFEFVEEYPWGKDFSILTRDDLTEMMSELRKKFNGINIEIQKFRNLLSDRLNEIINLEDLSENQYRKPLVAMLKMLDKPKDILEQIDITINAFDTLMEKLLVDISMLEKERDEIIDQLLSYVEELNEGLSKIDSNSTINVQGDSLKMLEITVPSWSEGREMYQLKLKDYIDEITKNLVILLNNNENPENELSSKINVNKIYDAVVGISNVSIKIYKIEKQRVYPISWSDAAKNSGGEGFLSTFIILSSLLYYIRKDENDLFADKNEGKVLLMDNPFAQTNADHLLKPLMEMARKNNTQLICLSGLGGESIYGRFDNIYVLNLIESKLNGNRRYLSVEHKRGAEPMNVSGSQVEVYEQMTLF